MNPTRPHANTPTQGGVTGAEIQLFGAMEGGDGIVFVPTDAAPEIRNVFVTHMTATHVRRPGVRGPRVCIWGGGGSGGAGCG